MSAAASRASFASARRVVVKVGSRVLVDRHGKPHRPRMAALVKEIVALRRRGVEVVLVSSGAVASGMEALGWSRRPKRLPELQMAAAVGQFQLMACYDRLFRRSKVTVGQILLTHDDLRERVRHLNVRNTLHRMLEQGVVPIVNENDVVSVDELKFGDNDFLAALVSVLLEADLLVLLTTTNGLRRPTSAGKSKRVAELERVDRAVQSWARGSSSQLSMGGMSSKLQAAQIAAEQGVEVVIADGRTKGIVERVCAGDDLGTWLHGLGDGRGMVPSRKRWIALFQRTRGAVVIDNGAGRALVERGTSLLPVGVRAVEGDFSVGSLVAIKTEDGQTIARGLVDYSSEELLQIKGCRTSEIVERLGACNYEEVVHRDNLVLLNQGG